MKLSEYIISLTLQLEEHGDGPCIYSSDDEGSSYHHIYNEPTPIFLNKNDSIDAHNIDKIFEEDDFDGAIRAFIIN